MEKKRKIFRKGGFLQIPFAWLFAIIVGAVILFLAIFLVVKIIKGGEITIDAKTGKEIGILTNPLETGFESGKTTYIILPVETRIYNKCDNSGEFGRQKVQISQRSFGKWTDTNFDVSFLNKYFFSDVYAEGKKFYLFSKPFNFPFKISDLIYITSEEKNYCFIDAPENIIEEISDLNQKNLLYENCSDSKSENTIKICFSQGGDCGVKVSYGSGYVEKKSGKMYFETDALMYAAIFSDKNIYECQVKRLMQRTKNLAILYKDKISFISQKSGCDSNLNLIGLSNFADEFVKSGSSANLNSINSIVKDIENKNEVAMCRLW